MSDVEISRLMLRRLGDGASGGLEPLVRDVSKVSAPAATKTTGSVSESWTTETLDVLRTTSKPPAGRAVLIARVIVLMPRSNGTLVYNGVSTALNISVV